MLRAGVARAAAPGSDQTKYPKLSEKAFRIGLVFRFEPHFHSQKERFQTVPQMVPVVNLPAQTSLTNHTELKENGWVQVANRVPYPTGE